MFAQLLIFVPSIKIMRSLTYLGSRNYQIQLCHDGDTTQLIIVTIECMNWLWYITETVTVYGNVHLRMMH